VETSRGTPLEASKAALFTQAIEPPGGLVGPLFERSIQS
jgi:hypothetical protein